MLVVLLTWIEPYNPPPQLWVMGNVCFILERCNINVSVRKNKEGKTNEPPPTPLCRKRLLSELPQRLNLHQTKAGNVLTSAVSGRQAERSGWRSYKTCEYLWAPSFSQDHPSAHDLHPLWGGHRHLFT